MHLKKRRTYTVTIPEAPFAGARTYDRIAPDTPVVSDLAIGKFVNSYTDPVQAFDKIFERHDPLRSAHLFGNKAISKFADLCVHSTSIHRGIDTLTGNACRLDLLPKAAQTSLDASDK